VEDVLQSVLLATLRASPNASLRAAYHAVIDAVDDDKELTFALIQDHCDREIRRTTRDPDRHGRTTRDPDRHVPVLRDSTLPDATGSRHTTQPAHAGVSGHRTTVSPLFFIAYPQTRVPAPSVLGPYADATSAGPSTHT